MFPLLKLSLQQSGLALKPDVSSFTAIFQPYSVISWLLAFDTQNSTVREWRPICFPRNWDTSKSFGRSHQGSRLDRENRYSKFECPFLLMVWGRCCVREVPVLWIPWIYHDPCASFSVHNWTVELFVVLLHFCTFCPSTAHCGQALSLELSWN